MRIIGGQASGRKLKAPPGRGTRPTSDRVKEALFSIIEARLGTLTELRVLDLFAGSGALGLEALSRGAESAVFVDRAIACQRTIHANATSLGVITHSTILRMEFGAALEALSREESCFELILADPPYAEQPDQVLAVIMQYDLLSEGGLLVFEHGARLQPAPNQGALELLVRKKYGDTRLSIFLQRSP